MSGTFDTKWRPKQIQPVPDLTKENFKQTESRNLSADFDRDWFPKFETGFKNVTK